jgi:hypothetical protein
MPTFEPVRYGSECICNASDRTRARFSDLTKVINILPMLIDEVQIDIKDACEKCAK